MNLISVIENKIKEAMKIKFDFQEDIEVIIEKPKKEEFGDYTSNISLKVSKILKMKPMEIADQILDYMNEDDLFECVDVKEPGFINIYMKKETLYRFLFHIEKEEEIKEGRKKYRNLLEQQDFFKRTKENFEKHTIEYVQYVHSRIYSIINIFEQEGISLSKIEEMNIDIEFSPLEQKMMKIVLNYSYILNHVVTKKDSEKMIEYIVELCALFYSFQEKTIFREMEEKRLSYVLVIVEKMRKIIEFVLADLNIEAPYNM
ncbi:hypothetical protein IZY60_02935 [Lutibacter sp. B2]|nr:hypothetical protein [Lutibacter sp. B2]